MHTIVLSGSIEQSPVWSSGRSGSFTEYRRRRPLALAAGAVLAILSPIAQGAIYNSVASGTYDTNATWSQAPDTGNPANGSADQVTIGAHTVTIANASHAALDTIGFSNDAAVLDLTSNAATNFSIGTLDLTGSNQLIQINRTPSSTASTTHTLTGSGLLLGGGRTLTVARGAGITGGNSGGSLVIAAAGSVTGNQNFSIANVGTGTGRITLSGDISGNGSITKSAGSGTLTLSGTNTYLGGTTVSSGVLQIGSGGTTGSIVGAVVTTATLSLNRSNAFLFTNAVSGTGAVRMDGTGVLTLSSSNTYTGRTLISTGTIETDFINSISGGASSSPLGAPTTAANGAILLGDNGNGTLRYIGAGETTDRAITLNQGAGRTSFLDASGTGALVFSSTATIAGVNTGTGAASTLALTGSNDADNILAGRFESGNVGSGGGALLKAGSGRWVLTNGLNTYNRTTTVSDGTLVGAADAINKLTPAGSRSGMAVTSVDSTTDQFTLTGHTLVLGDRVYISNLSGATGLTGGTTPNTAYYVTNVAGDSFQLANSPANAASGTPVNFGGASVTASLWQPGIFGTATSAIALGDASTPANGAPSLLMGLGAAGFTNNRPITLGTAAPATATFTIGGNSDAENTFSGLITANRNLTVSQVATTGSNQLRLTGGIVGSTVIDTSSLIAFTGPGAIHVEGAGISNGVGGGTGTVSTQVSGGSVTFAAASTYTGGTTVTGGTLLVNNASGSGTGSGAVLVEGGTLGGSGYIGGAVIVGNSGVDVTADAFLSPGNSIDSLDTGDLSFLGDGQYLVEVSAGVANDVTNVTGTVSLGAGIADLQVALTGTLDAGQKYWIVTNDGIDQVSGFFTGLAQDATVLTSGGYELKISYVGDVEGSQAISGGNDVVLYTVVPEPASLALLAGAGALLLRRRRVG